MRIGELADAVGVNTKTIRYYEEIGLFPQPARSSSGYRLYERRDVDRLVFIHRARELDLSLDEIAETVRLREQGQRPCDYVLGVAARRVAEIDERVNRMRQARDELSALLDTTEALATEAPCYCQLIEHLS